MTLDTSKNTADLFRDLNTLRKQRGMLPLKAWKESRSKLEAAITKLGAEDPDAFEKPAPTKKAADKMFSQKIKNDAERASREADDDASLVCEDKRVGRANKMKDVGTPPIVSRKAKTQAAPANNTFTAFLLSRSINAKVARAKLRRAGLKGPYALTAEVKKIIAP